MRLSLCNSILLLTAPAPPIDGLLAFAAERVDTMPFQTYRRPTHPDPARRGTLIQVLVQIVISQRARIENEVKAADALFSVYPGLADLATAEPAEIARLIRAAGLHEVKAIKISTISRSLMRDFGGALETALRQMDDATARQTLLALPGVGEKTADCMLELGLGRLRLPIETNIRKLGVRLGLARGVQDDDRLRDLLSIHIEPEIEAYINAHSLLMALGQRLCIEDKSRRSLCLVCDYIDAATWAA
jgi:endonuclease III